LPLNQKTQLQKASARRSSHKKKGSLPTVAVELTDFSVFYSQDSIANAEATLKNKASKIVVDKGQSVKVTKDAKGIVAREVLTQEWTDWIDYWAVDFDFENKREIIRVPKEPAYKHEAQRVSRGPLRASWRRQRTHSLARRACIDRRLSGKCIFFSRHCRHSPR